MANKKISQFPEYTGTADGFMIPGVDPTNLDSRKADLGDLIDNKITEASGANGTLATKTEVTNLSEQVSNLEGEIIYYGDPVDVSSTAEAVVGGMTAAGILFGIGTTNTYYMQKYPVTAGTRYRIQGIVKTNGDSYVNVGFVESVQNGVTADIIVGASTVGSTYDKYYTPEANGYILAWVYADSAYVPTLLTYAVQGIGEKVQELEQTVGSYSSDISSLQNTTGSLSGRVSDVEDEVTFEDSENVTSTAEFVVACMGRNGTLFGVGSTYTYGVQKYPVTAGTRYRIQGIVKTFGDSYINVGFVESVQNGVTADIIVGASTVGSTYDKYYTPEANGYILAWVNLDSTYFPTLTEYSVHGISEKVQENESDIANLQTGLGTLANEIPIAKCGIVCSGSSITWGDGRLDGSFVKKVDEHIKSKLSRTIFCSDMEFSSTPTDISNGLLYDSVGKMISGLNESVEFDLYGDEVAICQMKRRTTDFGIMKVYADNVEIGTFDNKNTIGHNTETFSGEDLVRVRLAHPCTFNHVIQVTTSGGTTSIASEDIVINTEGYGATFPSGAKAFVFRTLDADGNPTHMVEFDESLGTITSVTIEYDYGKIIAHERSLVGQTSNEYEDESSYGLGTISYDPADPTGGISSGMEFRGIDKRAFFIHKFSLAAKRHIKVKIVGGTNPYFVVNYATNRYHDLMNAGIGGWQLSAMINNDKINDYQQLLKWFNPDILLQESATNDDWNFGTRRISRSIGNITLDQLVLLPALEVSKVTYDSDADTYAVEMATGIITSITPTSLVSSDIVGTETQVGDIVRIGNYKGDNRQVVCRRLTSVDTATGEIGWTIPLNPEEINNVDSLADLVGAEINIRNLDTYKTRYKTLIESVRAVSPNTAIVVAGTGLSMYGLRQLWGYDIVHRELCAEYPNMKYCDTPDWIYDAQQHAISGTRKETVTSTGASSYTLSTTGRQRSWQGFQVLVDGIDVYGKDCYIECNYMYHANPNYSGSVLNKTGVYDNRGGNYYPSNVGNAPMRLVFTKNVPSSSSSIVVRFADTLWSNDYCHPSEYGVFVYGQIYSKMLTEYFGE